jgi:hypothetical protein
MLQLEYICTDAEMREARSLGLREQLGKGSRVRTSLVLFGILAAVLTLACFQIRTEISPRYRPWFWVFVAVVFVFFYFKNRRARKRPGKPAKMELSEREVTVVNDGIRVSTLWPGFSECLESPNLFVLVDKPKRCLLVFPKRAFPDEGAQNWFRSQAAQRPSVAASVADIPVSHSAPVPADGIALNFQLGYWDYFIRTIASWRTWGIVLVFYLTVTGMFFYVTMHPDPDPVNSPAKVYFLFLLPIFTVVAAGILPFMTFNAWRSDQKYLVPRQLVLGKERLDFAGPDGNGFIPWTTFKHFKENRWSFFVWNPSGQQWDMFPKRAFTSAKDIERCRALLQRHLRRSRWFFM